MSNSYNITEIESKNQKDFITLDLIEQNMKSTLGILRKLLSENPHQDTTDIEFEIRSLQITLDSLIEQKEYFSEFWGKLKNEYHEKPSDTKSYCNECKDDIICQCDQCQNCDPCSYFLNHVHGKVIDYIVMNKYEEKIYSIKCYIDEKKGILETMKKQNQYREDVEYSIREIFNFKPCIEMENCRHVNEGCDGTWVYCLDCSKNIKPY
jgi:hypothetical protein